MSILIISILTLIALLFLVVQLLKVNQTSGFLKILRDLMIVILSLGLTFLVFYVGYRLMRVFL